MPIDFWFIVIVFSIVNQLVDCWRLRGFWRRAGCGAQKSLHLQHMKYTWNCLSYSNWLIVNLAHLWVLKSSQALKISNLYALTWFLNEPHTHTYTHTQSAAVAVVIAITHAVLCSALIYSRSPINRSSNAAPFTLYDHTHTHAHIHMYDMLVCACV